ncbi:MAG: hypothetical protein COA42_18060 [Alteromonadaceae bacterium]|nr:MAG: hypothetical protein COA42_18060 [Alteromonadaceae bacterium]
MRYYQLDTLRYFFAAIVVIGHSSGWIGVVPAGALAVDFFFILSGFVLTYATSKSASNNYVKFIVSRFSRLFPLYLATLVFMLSVGLIDAQVEASHLEVWVNIFLLQNVIPIGNLGYNWPAWSVSVELWMNIGILFWVIRYRLIKTALLLIVLGYTALWMKDLTDHAHVQEVYFVTAGLLRCISGVLAGFVVFHVYQHIKQNTKLVDNVSRGLSTVLELATLCLIFTCLFIGGYRATIIALIIMPVFILVFSFGKGALSDFFSNKHINKLGNLTYGIYLIHIPALLLLRSKGVIPGADTETPVWIGLLVLLGCTLVSIPTYYYFEVPCKNFIMGKFKSIYSRSKRYSFKFSHFLPR